MPKPAPDERVLTERIIELAGAYGRYGYRRVTALPAHRRRQGERGIRCREIGERGRLDPLGREALCRLRTRDRPLVGIHPWWGGISPLGA